MRYSRKFELHISHFNGGKQYEDLEKVSAARDDGAYEEALELLLKILPEIHGHNFTITVDAVGEVSLNDHEGKPCFVVPDEEVTEIVLKWHDTNLSVHPDFTELGVRASAEYMALVLQKKLLTRWPSVHFDVSIEETKDIVASTKN